MRLTEALNLRFEDIDWAHGVLTIGRAKFQKARLVPLHKSALQELRTYIERRNQFFAERPWRRPVNRIFVSTHGGALTSNDVGAAKMSISYCRCSQPIWGTSSSPGPIGI